MAGLMIAINIMQYCYVRLFLLTTPNAIRPEAIRRAIDGSGTVRADVNVNVSNPLTVNPAAHDPSNGHHPAPHVRPVALSQNVYAPFT